MTVTTTKKTVKDSAAADFSIKTLTDSSDSTDSPAHAVLKGSTGAVIDPATEANQATANTTLAAVSAGLGAAADVAASSDTGSFSLIALFKRALQSLTTIIGNTGAGSVSLSLTPTITAGAYVSGQVIGGVQSFANAVRASGGSGIIQSASVTKKTALTAPVDLYFFSAAPTGTYTDNTTFTLAAADIPNLIGVLQCTTLADGGTPKTLQSSNGSLVFKLASGTTLYCIPVMRGAETPASTTGIIVNANIAQN